MQTKITTEDYFNSLQKLEHIRQEEINYYIFLNKNNISCKNTNQILKKSIIILEDKNKNYKLIIENKIKNFLKKYKSNERLYNLFKEKINFIVYSLMNNSINNNNIDLDLESKIITNIDNNFEFLLDDIKRLINKTKKNELEIEHLKNLILEKKSSLEIKNNFKTQTKKIYVKKLTIPNKKKPTK